MSAMVVVRHKRTGEEFTAWQDPEGLWIEDPEGPGYAWRASDWIVLR